MLQLRRSQVEVPGPGPPVEAGLDPQQGGEDWRRSLVAGLGPFLHLEALPAQDLQVGQQEFGFHHLHVPHRVKRGQGMGTALVTEAAHHVDQEVHLPDVPQKLVTQALSLGGALDEAGDVDKFDGRGGEFLGFQQLAQAGQTGVRDGHHPGVGADGAEGVGGHFRCACGQGIEDGGLPGVGQADDAAAPAHGCSPAVA